MKIKIIHRTSKHKVRRAVPFVRWWFKRTEKKYGYFKLTVMFVPFSAVCHPAQPDNMGFAAYCPQQDLIAVGTTSPLTERDVLESIAHECVHVEQRLRGVPYTERGVRVRSLNLIKIWKKASK